MRRLTFSRDFYYAKGATKVACKTANAVAYVWDENGRFHVVAFAGKAHKPAFNFWYRKPEQREAKIRDFFAGQTARAERKAAESAKRKAFVNPYKVGDIFRSSWGYDQTNVDYYQVIESKGKFVTVRAIGRKYVETGHMSGQSTPLPGSFLKNSEPKRCLAQGGSIKVDDHRWAYLVKPEIIAGVPVYPSSYESHYY